LDRGLVPGHRHAVWPGGHTDQNLQTDGASGWRAAWRTPPRVPDRRRRGRALDRRRRGPGARRSFQASYGFHAPLTSARGSLERLTAATIVGEYEVEEGRSFS